MAFMLTGFAALSVEVLWTRVLTLVIGTTVYAFSAMLGTFLLGLALGSAVFAGIAQRTRRPGLVLGVVVGAIGATVFLTSIAFGNLPLLYMGAGQKMGWGWASMMWIQLLFCLIIMLVPTFLMGGTFPLVTRIYVRDVARVGSRIGTAYAFNTVGSILGSFAGSFLLLQFLGIEKSLTAVAVVYLVVGLVLLLRVAGLGGAWRLVAGGLILAVGLAAVLLAPRWDPRLMTSAVYRYAQTYKTAERLREYLKDKRVLFYDDGPGATVTVERNQDELALGIDGKADASTSVGDMTTQTMLAHLPLLIHPKPDTVLVIGLGCGVSLGSVERYPVRAIDCVELLENVVRAARYFDDYNYRCLDDPRVNLILADARNHILLSDKEYDVIISEPTNPWIAGVGDLFTKEFFEMARRRLKPGGLLCAWFHIYHMGDDDLRSMAKTFLQVFPEATMWMLNDSDVIFLGSLAPLVFDEGMVRRFASPSVSADLERIWVRDITDFLSGYIWGKEGLARYAERATNIHTDDNMMLEYSAGRKVFQTTSITHLSNFSSSTDLPRLEGMGSGFAEAVRLRKDVRRRAMRGSLEFLNGRIASGIGLLEAAYAAAPSDPYVLSAYVAGHLTLAYSFVNRGDYVSAADNYAKAATEPGYPRSWQGYDGVAFCYTRMGDYAKARHYYELSLEANPINRSSSHNLAALYMAIGDAERAISVYKQTMASFPDDADAANGLARVYLARNENLDTALDLAREASAEGKKASHYNTLGWALESKGKLRDAKKALEKALNLEPDNSEALFRLGVVEAAEGNSEPAREALERLTRFGRRDEYSERARALLNEMGAR
jgi:spermidine synthase